MEMLWWHYALLVIGLGLYVVIGSFLVNLWPDTFEGLGGLFLWPMIMFFWLLLQPLKLCVTIGESLADWVKGWGRW